VGEVAMQHTKIIDYHSWEIRPKTKPQGVPANTPRETPSTFV